MIGFDHVYKRYSGSRDAWVLQDIHLGIAVGEMVFLLGPSGAGKSTLLKLVTLEVRPSQGRVRVQKYDSATVRRRQIPELRRRIGVVYQDFRLIRDKTVQENVAYILRMTGVLDPRLIAAETRRVLTTVGLYPKRHEFPENLSGGEQQRTAVARALVHQPSILLADEPTGNLDPGMGAEIMALLRRMNLAGATVVVATHDQDLAERFGDRIILLEDGIVRKNQEIRTRPRMSVLPEP
jgi:cell division transport system ATP-binding protein